MSRIDAFLLKPYAHAPTGAREKGCCPPCVSSVVAALVRARQILPNPDCRPGQTHVWRQIGDVPDPRAIGMSESWMGHGFTDQNVIRLALAPALQNWPTPAGVGREVRFLGNVDGANRLLEGVNVYQNGGECRAISDIEATVAAALLLAL